MSQRYPLSWPNGWTRKTFRFDARFGKTSVYAEVTFLYEELRRLGAKDIIISSNIPLRNDGLPRSGARDPDDPAVAVYFTLKKKPLVLACDRWRRVEHNIRAVAKHIESLRAQDRWGVGSLDQAFAGYAALPDHITVPRHWREVMGIDVEPVTEQFIRAVYRELAKKHHPDRGGNEDAMKELNAALAAALAEIGATT